MTTVFAFFEDVEPDEFRRATEVTYLGAVWGTRAALKRMLPRDRGTIVQVGSALAYRGIPLQSAVLRRQARDEGLLRVAAHASCCTSGSNVHMTMVQLPGLNTPQFDHCRTKMPKQPMPVPPIYQPEVAADAIYFAAHAGGAQVYVGGSTVVTILGNKVAPWLGDWYLARTGVKGQQTEPPIEPRDGNLFEPRRATRARTGASTRRRARGATSCGSTSTGCSSGSGSRPRAPRSPADARRADLRRRSIADTAEDTRNVHDSDHSAGEAGAFARIDEHSAASSSTTERSAGVKSRGCWNRTALIAPSIRPSGSASGTVAQA